MTTENVGRPGARRVLAADVEDSGARRDEILATASRLFAETGLRTSLQEIADACGIRPGSLYHHFDSKEEIVVELVQRYHGELDQLAARTTDELASADPAGAVDLVRALAVAIAQTADRHGAAVQLSFYEPPAGSDAELVRLAGTRPAQVVAAMQQALELARSGGLIRPGIDLALFAERMCSTMLYVGTGLFQGHATDRVANTLSTIFLSGMALDAPSDKDLDRSAAMQGVTEVIRTWQDPAEPADGDKAALIRAAARVEFGRRGYEVTTIRQIAGRAGVSTGAVYRAIGSKEELLASIATDFSQKVMLGWSATLNSSSSAAEKIDALFWLHIIVMERYYDEFKMQLAWLRHSPPETSMFHWSFQAAVRGLQAMLADGVKSGELRALNVSRDLIARCVLALTWMPEDSARRLDQRAALSLAREAVLRGALSN